MIQIFQSVFIKRFLGAQADYIRHDEIEIKAARGVYYLFSAASLLFSACITEITTRSNTRNKLIRGLLRGARHHARHFWRKVKIERERVPFGIDAPPILTNKAQI